MVNGLAKAAGIPIRRSRLVTIGGAGLGWFNVWELVRPSGMAAYYEDESEDGKLKKADFRKEKVVDAVILQANTKGPISPSRKAGFRKFAKQHAYDLQCFGIQPLIMMTWARKNRPEMTRMLADEATKVGNMAGAMVIPVGLAFAEVMKKYPEISLHRPDNSHPSPEGTYLEACVIFSSIFHRSPVGLNYYGEEPVDPKIAGLLQQISWNSVCEYFAWKN